MLPLFGECSEQPKNTKTIPGKGACLPSRITFQAQTRGEPEQRAQHSDVCIYLRWKKKIPSQQPEGTRVHISKLLRKTERSIGPRGCILAGIPAPASFTVGSKKLGLIRCLPADHKAGTEAEMPLLSNGSHHILGALVTRHHMPQPLRSSHAVAEHPQLMKADLSMFLLLTHCRKALIKERQILFKIHGKLFSFSNLQRFECSHTLPRETMVLPLRGF